MSVRRTIEIRMFVYSFFYFDKESRCVVKGQALFRSQAFLQGEIKELRTVRDDGKHEKEGYEGN